jgi:radical SAM superfamily enzyme YgiQ (UPF0313 family)
MTKNTLIYLCDLTHVSQGYAIELTPYPIGCLKTWLLNYSRNAARLQIEIFKHPQYFIDAFLEHKPAIVGFSNYMWNLDISYTIAREIKSQFPETFIIFGGPNFPTEAERQQQWLRHYSAVDLYIVGDGEEPFTEIVDLFIESGKEKAFRQNIDGCQTLIDGKLSQPELVNPRVKDLNLIPSPYLTGVLDNFLEDSSLTPLMESNRGCPFTCTYCADGTKDRTKVYRKSVGRFEEELMYIAQRFKGSTLTLADLNFGMYPQDLDVSKAIARVKSKYNYPTHLATSTGKNQKARVLECAELLEGSLRLSASVQSLDPDVLINVKRDNISADQLIELTQEGNKLDANTYSEVILGLPGDTRQKHMASTLRLADMGMKFIPLYTLMILDGSELSTNASRSQWRMNTKFRVVPRCFGTYDFQGKKLMSAEIEEVCVESQSLSLTDYFDCRSFALTMGIFFQDRMFYELYQFARHFSIAPSDIIPILHDARHDLSDGIRSLYSSFDQATKNELWDSRESLELFTKSSPEVIDKYANGKLGNNLLYRHRAIALLDLTDEIHEAVYKVVSKCFQDKDPTSYDEFSGYLTELKEYSLCRTRSIFDSEQVYQRTFRYDFISLWESDFAGLPKESALSERTYFDITAKKKALLDDQLDLYGKDYNGFAKLLSRVPSSRLYRNPRRECGRNAV